MSNLQALKVFTATLITLRKWPTSHHQMLNYHKKIQHENQDLSSFKVVTKKLKHAARWSNDNDGNAESILNYLNKKYQKKTCLNLYNDDGIERERPPVEDQKPKDIAHMEPSKSFDRYMFRENNSWRSVYANTEISKQLKDFKKKQNLEQKQQAEKAAKMEISRKKQAEHNVAHEYQYVLNKTKNSLHNFQKQSTPYVAIGTVGSTPTLSYILDDAEGDKISDSDKEHTINNSSSETPHVQGAIKNFMNTEMFDVRPRDPVKKLDSQRRKAPPSFPIDPTGVLPLFK